MEFFVASPHSDRNLGSSETVPRLEAVSRQFFTASISSQCLGPGIGLALSVLGLVEPRQFEAVNH